ncbi:MAG: FkbM family methyltransferase [Actinobacteria bacterium]|nr:MAG: FkbM family methyltransferase [Actinomycetota bacterium]
MNYIRKIKIRNESKASCTKSGLIPIKALNIFVKLLRFFRLYNAVYVTVLFISNVLSRRKLLRFYSQYVNEGDLCFDIGANIGNRIGVFLKLGATVVAVEPQNSCMRKLLKKYGNNNKVFLVHKALGSREGKGNLILSNSHTVSSMSEEWIDCVRDSDMFFTSTSAFQWHENVTVPVTTLDKLIRKYGSPAVCKIDVEGFEYQVIKGLSQPAEMISFEFTPTPKLINRSIESIKHLSAISNVQFNYSFGESMILALPEWVDDGKICNILLSIPYKTAFSGDIYARFIA